MIDKSKTLPPDADMSDGTSETIFHSILDSNFPVLVPYAAELYASEKDFADYLRSIKPGAKTTARAADTATEAQVSQSHPLVDALLASDQRNHDKTSLEAENKTLTANADVAFLSTKSALVDLFFELGDSLSRDDLEEALARAWAEDADATLKIIFNCRSIHLGKASRETFYRCAGWLYTFHPRTLLENLAWLTRPLIAKKVKKEDDKSKTKSSTDGQDEPEDVDEFVLVVPEGEDADLTQFDVKNGVAHGYWKDLLNILVLAVENELGPDHNIHNVLNKDERKKRRSERDWVQQNAKKRKLSELSERHSKATVLFNKDPTYRALHLTIARLFAAQLGKDIALLHSDHKHKIRQLSMVGKWAPSLKEFHDKHTFIASSIAEILHPHDLVCPSVPKADRETYLKHARESYRRLTLSPLRKALAIVERDITAKTFENIKYDRLPSLAIDRYQSLFVDKDFDHFFAYMEKVASGQKQISGAILLPSVLVSRALASKTSHSVTPRRNKKTGPRVNTKELAQQMVLDGQWKALVQRIRDSGTMQNAIAVCDVSGSMTYPKFKDGSRPMDSAIGLSLLLAEIVEKPWGGTFITFSENPTVQKVGGADDKRTFVEKVKYIMNSEWGMNTDLVKVFEQLILPVAIKNEVKKDDMVKQVFVFSDMQFDAATSGSDERWTTAFTRIKRRFEDAGYDMPEVVFWNLAGISYGTKPVGAPNESGVSLVGGYSQGQMKMFLDGGEFEDEMEEDKIEDDAVKVMVDKEKKKTDPLVTVRKAISHPAYRMLKVVD